MVRCLLFLLFVMNLTAEEESNLMLRFQIRGNKPHYPGERISLVYSIYYRGEIQLTEEKLPILQASGFKKVGGLIVRERRDGNFQVQDIIQEVETVAPGSFHFEASRLAGKTPQGEFTRAEIPPYTITVLPFPGTETPVSFTNAIGPMNLGVTLLTAENPQEGDLIKLLIELQGGENLSAVTLPDLFCQPGFSGFFLPSDLPPVAKLTGGKKQFFVELRVANALVKEIPPIYFSYFLPATLKYETVESAAIPILVQGTLLPAPKVPKINPIPVKEQNVLKPFPLFITEKKVPLLAPWHLLFVIPLVVLFLAGQYFYRDTLFAYFTRKKVMTPKELIAQAKRVTEAEAFTLLEQAFADSRDEAAKRYLKLLDEVRFGGKKMTLAEIIKEAEKIL